MQTTRKILSVLQSNVVAAKISISIFVFVLVCFVALKLIINPNTLFKDLVVLIIESIISTAMGVSLIAIAWDIAIRRQFLQEVRQTLKVSENFHKSGILRVRSHFNSVNWRSFYEDAQRIDLALFHATDTISHNRNYIIKAAEKGIEICVKLPDPNNQELIKILLSSDDDYEKEEIISSIIASINFFIGLQETIEK